MPQHSGESRRSASKTRSGSIIRPAAKKKKKRWRHKCPVCASAVDMSASSHWLLPPSLWRASGKDGIGCLESADRQTIVWRHWAGGAILVGGMWCVLTTLLLTSADWEDGGGHPSSRWGRKKRVTICSRYEVELSSTNMIIGFRTNKTWAIKYTT